MRALVLAVLLTSTQAQAGQLAFGPTATWDNSLDQWWTGAAVAFHPTRNNLVAPVARLEGGYSLTYGGPITAGELGLMVMHDHPEAVIRAGLVSRFKIQPTDLDMPFGGDSTRTGKTAWGATPGGYFVVEFQWGSPRTPLVLAGSIGMESKTWYDDTCVEENTPAQCVDYIAGIYGGLALRKTLGPGLYGEVLAGPSPRVTLGWALPTGKRAREAE